MSLPELCCTARATARRVFEHSLRDTAPTLRPTPQFRHRCPYATAPQIDVEEGGVD
jgi:hypothetical protein